MTQPMSSAGVRRPQTRMRVALAYIEHRVNVWLRFGAPVHEAVLDRWRRVAVFEPDAVCCRVKWLGNDFGTALWQLMVLQACTPGERMQRIAGIRPGARLLLRAEGEAAVQAVLQRADAIEALAIDPADAAPAYWRTLGNRLSARQPLPAYSAERHAAWLRGEALR